MPRAPRRWRACGFAAPTIPVPTTTCPTSGWSRPDAAAMAPMSNFRCASPASGMATSSRSSPLPDEVIVTKHRYGAFESTDLDLILRSRGIRSVIMTGVATNVCVETTARQALHARLLCRVHERLQRDVSRRQAADATLFNIDQFFGEVVTGEQIMACWPSAGEPHAGGVLTLDQSGLGAGSLTTLAHRPGWAGSGVARAVQSGDRASARVRRAPQGRASF